MRVLNGPYLRSTIVGSTLLLPLLPGIAGCGGGDGNNPAEVQATKESESKYEDVIKSQAKGAPKK